MARNINVHELDSLDANARLALMQRTETDLSAYMEPVRSIIDSVRSAGDDALSRFARELDHADVAVSELRATEEDFDRAFDEVGPDVQKAIAYAVENIRRFHEYQKPREMWQHEIRPGAFVGERWLPIPSTACYVPHGKGS